MSILTTKSLFQFPSNKNSMISPKKLIKMATKWQKRAVSSRKRIALPIATTNGDAKGHFAVYTIDEKRFVMPLEYLKNVIFRELLEMAEEEYGLPRDGPIMLPFDAAFMSYAVSLIQRNVTKDLEKAFLMSITFEHCLPSSHIRLGQTNPQQIVYSF